MTYVKLAAAVVVLIVLTALGLTAYRNAYKAGEDHIQAKWDANLADINRVAEAQVAAAEKAKQEALDNNEVIRDSYEHQLQAAQSTADTFAQRLRDAYASAGSRVLSKAGSGQGTASASQPPGDDRLTGLLARAAAECLKNTDQLDALTAEIKPQL